MKIKIGALMALAIIAVSPTQALAWGGTGHRTVAAVAAALLPPDKLARMNALMQKLEKDNNFIDGASYPDEYLRNVDPSKGSWHFADMPDQGAFACNGCLFDRLGQNLAIIRQGKGDKAEAVALSWVIHLVGDLHQPLHMSNRDRGGNDFAVTYRGKAKCIGTSHVELHSVWDDCLVGEAAHGRTPTQFAAALLGPIKTYKGRPEVANLASPSPWLAWGNDSHQLAMSVAFDHLSSKADLGDSYVLAPGNAMQTAEQQILKGGIRLAALLDANFK
jgi:hypothetical protein